MIMKWPFCFEWLKAFVFADEVLNEDLKFNWFGRQALFIAVIWIFLSNQSMKNTKILFKHQTEILIFSNGVTFSACFCTSHHIDASLVLNILTKSLF
jgi:hypothetical protein